MSETVTEVTNGFSGLIESSATAQCPGGAACTSGGIIAGHPDQVITASQLTGDGTGWYASFCDGPNGYSATVWADYTP
jgi:hypothetical protein